ncbi:hypothetical protein CLOM_g2856 [Closterium sp. NIES-68]|nr:hypothetical protein CLOM_g2856 [Closterium sp. NIES-68]GJP70064.1 hypothetical protein CLOP_g1053 [Closterium sp. NIES-67]
MEMVANLEAELYRLRRDRRLLLANLLTSLAAKGWSESDLDRINVDYILWCATSGTRVDIEAAITAQPTLTTRGEADFVTASTVILSSKEPSGPPPARLAPAFPVPSRTVPEFPAPPRLPPEPQHSRQVSEFSSAACAPAAPPAPAAPSAPAATAAPAAPSLRAAVPGAASDHGSNRFTAAAGAGGAAAAAATRGGATVGGWGATRAQAPTLKETEAILAPPRPLFPPSPPALHQTLDSPPPRKPKPQQLAKQLFASPSAASPEGYSTGSDGSKGTPDAAAAAGAAAGAEAGAEAGWEAPAGAAVWGGQPSPGAVGAMGDASAQPPSGARSAAAAAAMAALGAATFGAAGTPHGQSQTPHAPTPSPHRYGSDSVASSGAGGDRASVASKGGGGSAGSVSVASSGHGFGNATNSGERIGGGSAAAAAGAASAAGGAWSVAGGGGDQAGVASNRSAARTGASAGGGYNTGYNATPATVESGRGAAASGLASGGGVAAAGSRAGAASKASNAPPSATPAAAAAAAARASVAEASVAEVTPPVPTKLDFQSPFGGSGGQKSERGRAEVSGGKGGALGFAWRSGGTDKKLPPGTDVEGLDDDDDDSDDVASSDSSSCSDSSEMSSTLVAGGTDDGGVDQLDAASSAGRLKWPLRQVASGLTMEELQASAYEVMLLAAAESGSISAPSSSSTGTSSSKTSRRAAGRPESPVEPKSKSPGGFMSRFAKKVGLKGGKPADAAGAAGGGAGGSGEKRGGNGNGGEGGGALPPELIRMRQQLGVPESLHLLLLSAVFLPPPSHTVEMPSPISPLAGAAAVAAAAAIPPLPLPLCLLLHLSPIPSSLSSSFSPGVGTLKSAASSLAASFASLSPDVRRAFYLRQVKLLQELLLDLTGTAKNQGAEKGGERGGVGEGDECAEVAASLDAMLALVKGHEFITSPPSFEAKWSRKLSELRWLLVGGFAWGGRRGNAAALAAAASSSNASHGKQLPVLPGAWCPSRASLNASLYHRLLSACCDPSDSASFNDLLFEMEERVEALRSTWQPLGVTPVTHSALQAWTLCHKASAPTLPHPPRAPLSPSPLTAQQQQLLPIRAVIPLICQSLRRLPPTACARPPSSSTAAETAPAAAADGKEEPSAKVPLRPFVQSVSRFLSSLLSDYHHTLLEASSASGSAMSADGLAALESALDSYLCCCDLLEAGRKRNSHRHTAPGGAPSVERVEEVLEFVHMSVLSSFDRACLDAMAAAQAQQHAQDERAGSTSPSSSLSPTNRPNAHNPTSATSRDFRSSGSSGEVGLAQMAELASVIIEREAGGMGGRGDGRAGKGGGRGGGGGGEGGTPKGGCCAVFQRLGVFGTAAVAAAALHQQLDSQLDPFLSVVSELHPDCCKVFSAVDAFDRRVQQVVQLEVRAEEERAAVGGEGERHGGYGHAAQIASELNAYQIDPVMKRLFSAWVSSQQQKLHVWLERGVEAETFEPASDSLKHCASAVDAVRLVEEVLEQFFRLGLPPRLPMLQQMVHSSDTLMASYVAKISSVGPRDDLKVPPPPLTRFKEDVAQKLADKAERRAEREERVQKGRAGYLEGLWHARKGVGGGGGGGGGGGKVGVRAVDAVKAAAIDALTVGKLCVRINTLEFITAELDKSEKALCERWDEYAPHLKIDDMAGLAPSQVTSSLAFRMSTEGIAGLKRGSFFEQTNSLTAQRMQTLSDYLGTKVVWWDLREAFLEELYRVSVDSCRMSHLMQRLDPVLGEIVETVSDSLRDHVVTSLLHSVLEGLLRVLLDGGPLRVFAQSDYDALEDDLRILKEFFVASGNGLPQEVVNKAAAQVQQVLNYYSLDTADVILVYKQSAGSSQAPGGAFRASSYVKGGAGLTGHDAHLLLRVLCHRADRDASKFLKKNMHLPKSY